MKKTILSLVFMTSGIFFLLLMISCGGGSTDTDDTPIGGTQQLTEVADYQLVSSIELLSDVENQLSGLGIGDFFERSFVIIEQRDPDAVISDGNIDSLPINEMGLSNIADDYYFQTVEIKTLILTLLQTYNREMLSTADQLSFDVYLSYLEFEIEKANYRDFEYPATYGFFGWPGATEQFFTELVPINNKTDADNYLLLLNQIGRRFEQIQNLLNARQNAGVIEPSITLSYSQGLVNNIANSAVTAIPYYTAFQQKIGLLTNISDTDKQSLTELLTLTIEQRVKPAYLQLSQTMAALVNSAPANIGFGQFEGGAEFYDFKLRYFTSSDQTAEQIHQLGLQELARIHGEMRTLFDQLGYPQNETMAQLFQRVNNGTSRIPGNEAVAFYENIISETYAKLPAAFSTLPQQEVIVIGGNTGGFYISSSEDGTRPAAFYANTSSSLAYTTMPTLTYHEAIPGHHLQIALAQELDLPRFRRNINFTSFVEGWALYAERLAKDLNWYENDSYGDLGRLQFEAMRAARLVLDTGIHSKGWTYQQAEEFNLANVGDRGSIARYSVWPGQATAYTTGMLKILELRQHAENQLGEQYDIRDFHQVVIGNGSMPTNLLDGLVNRYINESQLR